MENGLNEFTYFGENKSNVGTMGDAISTLLFQPPPPTYLHPSRHFWLNTATGSRIPAFFIERPNAQVTILFSHGNAEDLGMIYDWFNDLARVLRVNIMAYDYTGCEFAQKIFELELLRNFT